MGIKTVDWATGSFIVGYHTLLAICLPLYFWHFDLSLGLALTSIVLFCLCSLSITLGYHRYYSHRAFAMNKWAERVTLFFGTFAVANAVLPWAHDHRIHHQYVDTERDPYNATKGFLHSHLLWMFTKRKDFDENVVKDLLSNSWVVFQNKYYIASMLIANALVLLPLGFLLNDFLGVILIAGVLRMAITHHVMWFINSLAHMWGTKPYSKEHTAVNNWFLAFFTFGEGYHNYHHTFASDYRNGVRWFHFDPTKYTIWMLSKIGLTSNLKRINYVSIRKKMYYEDRRVMIAQLKSCSYAKFEELEEYMHNLYARMHTHLATLHKQRAEYKALKKAKASKSRLAELKEAIKHQEKSYDQDKKNWYALNKHVRRFPTQLPS